MKIGKLNIKVPLFFAPLAGYSDRPTRKICKEFGAGVVCTEFVSSEGLIRDSEKTKEYLNFDEDERPISIQIFGHRAQAMAEAASMVEQEFNPDIIDINMGCSVRKVVKKGAGAALLKDLDQAEKIAKATVKAVHTPVTAKIRLGWTRDNNIAIELARRMENSGIKALTVHPRSASEGFNGNPAYKTINDVVEVVSIPVIGNGDIDSVRKAKNVLNNTGCEGIMIGRWVLGNPWLFTEIKSYLLGHDYEEPEVSITDRINLCKRHLKMEVDYRGPEQANKIMKKFYKWYFKGFPNASNLRNELVLTDDIEATYQILESFENKNLEAN